MKHALIITTMVVLFTGYGQARVGETEAEILARYGKGEKARDRVPGTETFKYVKDNFKVEVVISNGKSVMETFERIGKVITDADIKEILKANGDKHGWGFDIKSKHWVRSDYKLHAFREPGHDDFFFIQDISVVKGLEGKNKGKPGGL